VTPAADLVDAVVDRLAARLAGLRRWLRGRVDPDRVVLAVTVLGFDAALFAALRYGPAYLRDLGNGPVIAGVFGATLFAGRAAVRWGGLPAPGRRRTERAGNGDPGAGSTASVGSRPGLYTPTDRDATTLAAGLAGVGLGAWVLAPDGTLPGPAWLPVVVGLVPVAAWTATRTAAWIRPDGAVGEEAALAGGFPPAGPTGPAGDTPAGVAIRSVATAGAVLVAVALVTAADGTVPAVQVLAGLGGALGVVAAVVRVTSGTGATDEGSNRGGRLRRDGGREAPAGAADGAVRSRVDTNLGAVRRAVATPTGATAILVGDALVRLGVAVASVFVVLTVTGVFQLSVTVAGTRLGPAATYGLLVCLEVGVAALAATLGSRLARVGSTVGAVIGGDLVAVAFPLALVSLPADAAILAGAFACFGLRFLAAGPRRTVVTAAARAAGVAPRTHRARRAAVAAAGPLIGGAAFVVSPVLAFGLATAVGTVGVWELGGVALAARSTDGDGPAGREEDASGDE
jgi:hypothetical protein